MREKALSVLSVSVDKPQSLSVLSTFQVDHYQFLVVSLEDDAGAQSSLAELTHPCKTAHLSKTVHSPKTYVEVDRFEVDGQLCAIVKVEQTPSIEIDLITLLTGRELQIATLVASGQANKQIAHQLCISEWTVSTHLRRIFIKLGVDSRAAMVYRCAPIIQKLLGQGERVEG